MALTPGQYLRKRREAAGLSLDDVALCFETVPPIAAAARAEWLGLVEADAVPLPAGIADALHDAFPFDPRVLAELAYRLADDPDNIAFGYAVCRSCACSELDPCGEGCSWVPGDTGLCTRCRDRGLGAPGGDTIIVATLAKVAA
ncbi:helix-turn-helix domain-containing protein [Sphingomonas sp. IW22]|uniref:helix-turn-helix domain-containing protein n=1 Tax=Sphingomonas sp. IW22 TaxID=3242489 RepID=UPI0035230BD1